MNALELKFKKMGTAQLLVKVDKLSGEDKEACVSVLRSRGHAPKTVDEPSAESKVYEMEPEQDIIEESIGEPEKGIDHKDKSVSRSVSVETKGLKLKSKVSFVYKESETEGVVVSLFDSHKSGKEICGIKLYDSSLVHKRTNKLKLLPE